MLLDQYADKLIGVITRLRDTQREQILAAAQLAADTICHDGIIYVFGSGHSHLLAEEVFYRAGGLACVSPMLNEPLMLHESAVKSSSLEKTHGLASKVLAEYEFGPHDLLMVISNSGVNAVPVELAVEAKEMGVKVIGISSRSCDSIAPRNKYGLHLHEAAELSIDNAVPYGDACLQPEGLETKMTPVSTVAGSYILHSILSEAVQLAVNAGAKVPIYTSANIPGGGEKNQALIDRYSPRIRCL